MCTVAALPAICSGLAVTFTHFPASVAEAEVMATIDLVSNDASVAEVTGVVVAVVHAPAPSGAWMVTVRSTLLTVVLLDMSSSCKRTHLTRLVPVGNGAVKGAHGVEAVNEAVVDAR